jgi:glucosyl-dolichyl phosphate glucuronosyltransferase
VRLTVAVCTRNRAALLARTLDSLAAADPPAAAWDLIVVDNGSQDGTARVLDEQASRLPLRAVREPSVGLSHARNAAVAHATGDYLLWIDDDVRVDRGWLREYEAAIHCWPEAALFGGPIRPDFERTPPPWLLEVWPDVADAYAVRDFGAEPIPFSLAKAVPYGANFVVRAIEQRRFPYDPSLGRRDRAGTLGEETAVVRAILSSGGTGWWVPGAGIDHWVSTDRQTVAYLRQYFEFVGRTPSPRFRHEPSRVRRLSQYLRAEYTYRRARLSREPRQWIGALIEASILRARLTAQPD